MKKTRLLAKLAATLALLVAPADPVGAQTVSPANAASAPAEEKTIELSPFVVNAEEDTGYVATNTLGGSRLNTRLIDTAAAIDVLTPEFLEDIGAVSLEEAVEYATNASNDLAVSEGSDNLQFEVAANRVNMRGLPASRTRNFLPISYSADIYNVDRVEEQRGPNSILFGIGSPAGILNVNTKKAVLKSTIRRGSLMLNGPGGYRATVDLNQPVGDSFALRLNAVHSDLDDAVSRHAFRKTQALHLAGTAHLGSRVRFRAEYETADDDSVQPNRRRISNQVTQWLFDPETPGYTFADWQNPGVDLVDAHLSSFGNGQRGTYIDNDGTVVNFRRLHTTSGPGEQFYGEFDYPELMDRSVNPGGPGQRRLNTFEAWGATVEVTITPETFLELAYGHNGLTSQNHAITDEGLRASPNNFYVDNVTPNPYAGDFYIDGQWRQFNSDLDYDSYRATLSHHFDLERWGDYRIALMYEVDEQFSHRIQRREGWRNSEGFGLFASNPRASANRMRRRHYIEAGDVGNWGSYYVSSPADFLVPETTFDTGQVGHSAWYNQHNPIDNDNTYETYLVGLQARYFRNRLVLGLGFRKDSLDQKVFDIRDENNRLLVDEFGERITSSTDFTLNRYKGETKTLGAVYHINENLRLMYNFSDNFGLPHASKFDYPDRSAPENTKGIGHDYGIGFRFLDNRISGRITRFETDSTNSVDFGFNLNSINSALLDALVLHSGVTGVTQAQADTMFIDGTGGTFDQHVEGYELALTLNLTRNWRLNARYSYTDGFRSNSFPVIQEYRDGDPQGRLGGFGGLQFFENPAWAGLSMGEGGATTIGEYIQDFKDDLAADLRLDGVGLAKNTPHKANFFTRYTFSDGPLQGLFVGGGVKYLSARDLGVFTGPGLEPTQYFGNSRWTADALLGYSFKRLAGLKNVSVQLNVTNVFDDQDPIIIRRYDAAPFEVRSVTFERPRQWRLTTNFAF